MVSNKEFSQKLKARIFSLVLETIKYADLLDWKNPFEKVARDQLVRSVTSIGANYFEAIAGSSRKDFANFNNYALKSSNETQYWLLLIKETSGENNGELGFLLREVREIARILGAIVRSLRKK